MAESLSVCERCGACCASFRITLPRQERDDLPGGWVPAGLTEPYTPTAACMREHPAYPQRCLALTGNIGISVACEIYPHRPSACRDFAPMAVLGIGDAACDEARGRHGLRPLGKL